MKRIFGSRKTQSLLTVSILLVTLALIAGVAGCGTPRIEIWDWYDLDAVRDNLGGSYILMNNLDSTTPGYISLASPTANGGKGWDPIGTRYDWFEVFSTGKVMRYTTCLSTAPRRILWEFSASPLGMRTSKISVC